MNHLLTQYKLGIAFGRLPACPIEDDMEPESPRRIGQPKFFADAVSEDPVLEIGRAVMSVPDSLGELADRTAPTPRPRMNPKHIKLLRRNALSEYIPERLGIASLAAVR